MKKPLTDRQHKFLDLVEAHINLYGCSPTRGWLAERMGIKIGGIHHYIKALIDRGYLAKDSSTRPNVLRIL